MSAKRKFLIFLVTATITLFVFLTWQGLVRNPLSNAASFSLYHSNTEAGKAHQSSNRNSVNAQNGGKPFLREIVGDTIAYAIAGVQASHILRKPAFMKKKKVPSIEMMWEAGLVSDKVINPHDFEMSINEPKKCMNPDGSKKPVFLLVLVLSTYKHTKLRTLVRDTWGSITSVDGKNIITLFLLGRSHDPYPMQRLELESREHGDLLMESFEDTYRNLSRKTIMGMKWAGKYCGHASYVMKTDDDMYVGYESLIRHLAKPDTPSRNFMTGYRIDGGPFRNVSSKWYVPPSIYPFDMYPPFCSGSGYVLSGELPQKIYEISLHTFYLYLEDVYLAMCLYQLEVEPTHHKGFNNFKVDFSVCKYRNIFTSHMPISVAVKYKQWHQLRDPTSADCLP
ncbi:beta-1,3-galactosyltransferase 1-like [Diadema setosum]|uniref:beta-1,3-galactosyltransferase 1-like n=1 Tax=Diadema setosum TaxID=31175 RepID=UPI003B3B0FA8